MAQSRRMSAVEKLADSLSGFLVAWLLNAVILPRYGVPVHASQAFQITLIFTIVSLIRGYWWRRLFNRMEK